MKIPNGTAAVSAEAVHIDESRSLGNWEGRVQTVISVSQKTCSIVSPARRWREGSAVHGKTAVSIYIDTAFLFLVFSIGDYRNAWMAQNIQ